MTTYPVHFEATRPQSFERYHIVMRLLILLVLSILGGSLGWLFGLLYLLLPAFAAFGIGGKNAARFLHEDAPGIERLLRWVIAFYAYLALLTDRIPTKDEQIDVEFEVTPTGAPTTGSALFRLASSIPSLIFLFILGIIGAIVWLVAMLSVLISGSWPDSLYRLQVGVMRYQARFLVWHASLVDTLPPFALDTGHEDMHHPDATASNI